MDRIQKALDVLSSDCANPFIISDMRGVLETRIAELEQALRDAANIIEFAGNVIDKNIIYDKSIVMENPYHAKANELRKITGEIEC